MVNLKVSIVIPCYNVEKYIYNTLKHASLQTYENVEIICIDDGSSDETVFEIRRFIKEQNKKIKVLTQKNQGACVARNRGVEISSGAYIQFLDGDDIILPDKIATQVDLAKNYNMPDLIVGSYERINETGKIILKKSYNEEEYKSKIWISLMKTDLGITSSNLFKKELFNKGLEWNENLASSQEYALMFEILKNQGQVLFDPNFGTRILERESGSISQSNLRDKWVRYIELRIEIINFLKKQKKEFPLDEANQILFDAIRTLYPFDKTKAVFIFNKHLGKQFIPSTSNSTSKRYVLLYKLLGFEKTEKLKSILKF